MEAPATISGRIEKLVTNLDLHANSLIITIFGDAILPYGGNIWLGSLIALARPFGISERLVRTGVYRLAGEGWLEAQSKGRRSYYTLTASGRAEFAATDRRIYAATSPKWDGRWQLVKMLPRMAQTRRQDLRRELKWLGFGQISPNLLAHPSADDLLVERILDGMDIAGDVFVFHAETAQFVQTDTIRDVAEEAWNLKALNTEYADFVRIFSGLRNQAESPSEISDIDAFALRTALIHDYRRILLKDPQLPADFLPERWSGTAARSLCAEIYGAIARRADAHVAGLMETFDGTLPNLSDSYKTRFGGLPG